MFIAMNPSTADADSDDPTIRRESDFARLWGYGGLVKTNVMDYRATRPRDLVAPGVVAQSPANIPVILRELAHVSKVVVAWGRPHQTLRHHYQAVAVALATHGCRPWCLGRNLDQSPRHPLYLKKTTALEPFELSMEKIDESRNLDQDRLFLVREGQESSP
jgi:hypothetical protein